MSELVNAESREDFEAAVSETPDRELLEFIAVSIFEVKDAGKNLQPMLAQFGKSPMGKMLGL